MKKILYIGNKLEKHGAAPTSIDTLPDLLQREDLKFIAVSSIRSKPLRLLHMLSTILFYGPGVDLVLIDTYSTSNFWYARLCGRLCLNLKIPYTFLLHGGKLKDRFKKCSARTLMLFRKASCNIVPSPFLLDHLQQFHFGNLKLIPNSINIAIYPYKKRKKLKPQILWLRAFDEVYNPKMALDGLEILLKDHPEAELCMVGPDKDGSLQRMQELATKKSLPVKFTGMMEKKEWIELAADFDIFINTTSVDNTPVSVLEAMALGLPVVSTNVGGIPYLLKHEETGLLVENNNSNQMAACISRLLKDPDLAERLSKNGRKKVENYDWQKLKHLWLELLN